MSIADGKLLYDRATGKLMYDRATGKLLYGLEGNFTYAQMLISFVPGFIPPWVPQTITFKLQEGTTATATSWSQVAVDDPDPTYDMDWFNCAVQANTAEPFPPPGPNPVVDGYRWNAQMTFSGVPYSGSTVFLLPTAGAPPPHDYPAGVHAFTLTMNTPASFPLVMTVTLTLSESPILPFT